MGAQAVIFCGFSHLTYVSLLLFFREMTLKLPFTTTFYVDVRGDGAPKFEVYMYPNHQTVRDLKNAIHDKLHGWGIVGVVFNQSWIDACKLRCHGKVLDDDSRTLSSCGIKENTKVMCDCMA